MKRFGVNIVRIIRLEQSVNVPARDDDEARHKVQKYYDNGKGGDPIVTFKNASGLFKQPNAGTSPRN